MGDLPRGWRENPGGDAACPHRDVSVCPACQELPEVVEVLGQHFWVPTLLERIQLALALERIRGQERGGRP